MLQEHVGVPLSEEISKNIDGPFITPVRQCISLPLHVNTINAMVV